MNARNVAQGLAAFSLALGAYEALQAEELCQTLGLEGRENIVRAFGLREIASGLGIFGAARFAASGMAPMLWARVAGDALDSAVLGMGLSPSNSRRRNVLLAIALVSPVILLDIWSALQLSRAGE